MFERIVITTRSRGCFTTDDGMRGAMVLVSFNSLVSNEVSRIFVSRDGKNVELITTNTKKTLEELLRQGCEEVSGGVRETPVLPNKKGFGHLPE